MTLPVILDTLIVLEADLEIGIIRIVDQEVITDLIIIILLFVDLNTSFHLLDTFNYIIRYFHIFVKR